MITVFLNLCSINSLQNNDQMSKIHNFSAGPAILPQEALDASIEAIKNFAGTGLSLLEVSHRGKEFEKVMDDSRAIVKELFNIPDNYSVLFLQGGASTQFAMVPHNFLGQNEKAAYVNSGVWATKAIKEAKFYGTTEVIGTSEEKNFSYVPKGYKIPTDAKYLHITSNNTIYGTQLHEFPESPIDVVCDMSSDIFSRPVDVSKFALIYAGAQKNMGPAGVTLVIVRNDWLEKQVRNMPTMFSYKIHAENESMYNTPPVFAIFCSLQTMLWVKKMGGVAAMEKRNKAKAELLYNEIDRNPLFSGTCAKEDRSLMNVTFVANDKNLEEQFFKFCKERNLSGLKGHRIVGGFRASLYNALPIESVQALVDAMKDFETSLAKSN